MGLARHASPLVPGSGDPGYHDATPMGFAVRSSGSLSNVRPADAPAALRRSGTEDLEPSQRQGVGDRLRPLELLARLAPVEPQPARGMLLRSPEEGPELPGPAHQGERLLDHHRLARGCESLERCDRLIDLPGLRIEMDAY